MHHILRYFDVMLHPAVVQTRSWRAAAQSLSVRNLSVQMSGNGLINQALPWSKAGFVPLIMWLNCVIFCVCRCSQTTMKLRSTKNYPKSCCFGESSLDTGGLLFSSRILLLCSQMVSSDQVTRKARPKQRQVQGLCEQFVLNGIEFWSFKCWVDLLVACLVNGRTLNQVLNESNR